MRILLAAINAKYIHSNPAVFSLKACAELQGLPEDTIIEIGEYTINHNTESVRADLYRRQPDVIAFSCYIWNISSVEILVRDLKKILPRTRIWLGGPEVSWHPREALSRLSAVEGIMAGPGEKTFMELTRIWSETKTEVEYMTKLRALPGIVYRDGGEFHANAPAQVLPLRQIPFWYQDLSGFENRIIYYESSRGCPFRCSYCLSSIEKELQFREPEQVCRELQFFLDHRVPQVKFIDRTFNCRESHALRIWRYIAEHDNQVTNFHFEIAADLLTEAELEVLETMRPGLVQLEIGVQSVNPQTVCEIRRVMDIDKVREHVMRINRQHNIHQHLDLIAGLPYEDYHSFGISFDRVYEMEPEQLQLGFLKVLKGAAMETLAENYELCYSGEPPYEVLSTRWLSYGDVLCLKGIEEMVEMYYNSGQFRETLKLLVRRMGRPFVVYEGLAEFWKRMGYESIQSSRSKKYQILLAYVCEVDPEGEERYRETLIRDCYLRENLKNRPDFGPEMTSENWDLWKDFLQEEAKSHRYLTHYRGKSYRDLMNLLHGEILGSVDGQPMLWIFDYSRRDPLNHNAAVQCICMEEVRAYAGRS